MTPDELINQVMEGEEPEEVVKTLLDSELTEKNVAIIVFNKPSDMMRAVADLEDMGKSEGTDFQIADKNELLFVGKSFDDKSRKLVQKFGATIKESQKEVNQKNVGGYSAELGSNPYGGINNQIYLRNSGDASKVRAILDKKHIHYTEHEDGIFGFDFNSARDGAAQAIKSAGIQIKRTA